MVITDRSRAYVCCPCRGGVGGGGGGASSGAVVKWRVAHTARGASPLVIIMRSAAATSRIQIRHLRVARRRRRRRRRRRGNML